MPDQIWTSALVLSESVIRAPANRGPVGSGWRGVENMPKVEPSEGVTC